MIIDEKGKLFGKVNIIDLIILIAIVAAVAVVGINFFRSNTSAPANVIQMEFYAEEVSDFVAKKVKVGADLYDDTDKVMLGKVTEVKTGPSVVWINTSDGRVVKSSKEGFRSITITGEMTGEKTSIGATVGGVKYGVGHSMVLRAGDAKIYLRVSELKVKE